MYYMNVYDNTTGKAWREEFEKWGDKELTKEDVKRLQDNINSIPRESINNKTPYELTKEKYPTFIEKLDIKYIKPDEVTLNKKDILTGGDNND